MKVYITLIALYLSCMGVHAQVDILDKDRKVIKTVQEKDLKRTVDSIGYKAQFTGRWIEKKAVECRIKVEGTGKTDYLKKPLKPYVYWIFYFLKVLMVLYYQNKKVH